MGAATPPRSEREGLTGAGRATPSDGEHVLSVELVSIHEAIERLRATNQLEAER